MWLAEFFNRDMEVSFQSHIQPMIIRQLRIALIVWGVLLLLFAIPDFIALGPIRPFYYLLAYRIVAIAVLLILIFSITPATNIFKISYPVALFIMAYISGFMIFFIYRSDAVYLVVGVIMIQIIALLMFIPIRFIMLFSVALYAVFITLITRYALGTTAANLVSLFVIMLLPVVVGAVTTSRTGILHRKEFVLRTKTEKINRELANEIKRRCELEAKLKELASTDPLTGLLNRREYEILFTHEIERALRKNTVPSVFIFDIDHFKNINDTYGHDAGDEVLRRMAGLFHEELRSIDIVGRLGGDEFIILLPEITIESAAMIGKRLLAMLAKTDINVGTATIRITAAIGISQVLPSDRDFKAVIQRADEALYRAKKAGRNRVEVNLQ
jgi:diguanylate cyclase (GGDEF)-like protein